MTKGLQTLLMAGTVAATWFGSTAGAAVIDFDNLPTGVFVGAQYFASNGVVIAADNARANGPDVATLINSDTSNPQDRDLEYNWDAGNLVGSHAKNLLIIAENVATDSGGRIKSPDDEKEGGTITVSFSRPLSSFGFDLLDMEAENAPLSSIKFYSNGILGATVPFSDLPLRDATVVWSAENSGNRIRPITAASLGLLSFNAVVFSFNTSHAIDRFEYTELAFVPEPTASMLVLLGGFGIARRRR